MSEMVERVAVAISHGLLQGETGFKAAARAAIEAMRPTEDELRKAGCDDDNSGAPYCVDCSFLAGQYGKLIDAALKD